MLPRGYYVPGRPTPGWIRSSFCCCPLPDNSQPLMQASCTLYWDSWAETLLCASRHVQLTQTMRVVLEERLLRVARECACRAHVRTPRAATSLYAQPVQDGALGKVPTRALQGQLPRSFPATLTCTTVSRRAGPPAGGLGAGRPRYPRAASAFPRPARPMRAGHVLPSASPASGQWAALHGCYSLAL